MPTMSTSEGRQYSNSSGTCLIPQYTVFVTGITGMVITNLKWETSIDVYIDTNPNLLNFIIKVYCPSCPVTYGEIMQLNIESVGS
jgi:predicted RNA-binding protein with TRAM domain